MARTKGWVGKLSRFGEYLKTHKVDRAAIAAGCGITPSYISMLAHGKARPGFGLARRVEAWTRGNVVAAAPPGASSPTGCEAAAVPAPFGCLEWETEPLPKKAPPSDAESAPAAAGDETAAA